MGLQISAKSIVRVGRYFTENLLSSTLWVWREKLPTTIFKLRNKMNQRLELTVTEEATSGQNFLHHWVLV